MVNCVFVRMFWLINTGTMSQKFSPPGAERKTVQPKRFEGLKLHFTMMDLGLICCMLSLFPPPTTTNLDRNVTENDQLNDP